MPVLYRSVDSLLPWAADPLASFKPTCPSEPTNPASSTMQPPLLAMLPSMAEDAEAVTWGFTRNQARSQDEQRSNPSTSICNHKDQKVWLLTNMHVVWTLSFSWLLHGGKSLALPISESMWNEYVMSIKSYTSHDNNCILTTLPIVEYTLLLSWL